MTHMLTISLIAQKGDEKDGFAKIRDHACAWPASPHSDSGASFTFHEQLVIGNDDEAPAKYLFSYPKLVRTDSKGNIYVKDQRRADVRVFDANGRYVATLNGCQFLMWLFRK